MNVEIENSTGLKSNNSTSLNLIEQRYKLGLSLSKSIFLSTEVLSHKVWVPMQTASSLDLFKVAIIVDKKSSGMLQVNKEM